jgi:hypothetical protein
MYGCRRHTPAYDRDHPFSPMGEADLPTAQVLRQGLRVERLGSDEAGSYFAVLDNPRSALSPQRRMVLRLRGGAWYCEGKNDGCPALTDCLHVSAAKVALSKGNVPTAEEVLQINSEVLAKATRWLKEWDGNLPEIGAPTAGPSFDRVSGRSGEVAGGDRQWKEGLTDEQRYLMGLLMKQPHKEQACAGSSCFCRKHSSLFEEARPPSEGSPEAMEEGDKRGASTDVQPRKRMRRSKAFSEEERSAPRQRTVHSVRSKRPTPPCRALRGYCRSSSGPAERSLPHGRSSQKFRPPDPCPLTCTLHAICLLAMRMNGLVDDA